MARLPNEGRNALLKPYDELPEEFTGHARVLAQSDPFPASALAAAIAMRDAILAKFPEADRSDLQLSIYGAVLDLSGALPNDPQRRVVLAPRVRRWTKIACSADVNDGISAAATRTGSDPEDPELGMNRFDPGERV